MKLGYIAERRLIVFIQSSYLAISIMRDLHYVNLGLHNGPHHKGTLVQGS